MIANRGSVKLKICSYTCACVCAGNPPTTAASQSTVTRKRWRALWMAWRFFIAGGGFERRSSSHADPCGIRTRGTSENRRLLTDSHLDRLADREPIQGGLGCVGDGLAFRCLIGDQFAQEGG